MRRFAGGGRRGFIEGVKVGEPKSGKEGRGLHGEWEAGGGRFKLVASCCMFVLDACDREGTRV